VRRNLCTILEKLPRTLDETYERILKEINEDNREDARRLLHCIAVAIRPLRVEELAEILAFDFTDLEGDVPKFCADWRSKDQEGAVLSTCSSLISVVDSHDDVYPSRKCRVVQFAHFSVKEFLISDRLASVTGDVSRYHILPRPAHTILAQACLGFILHLQDPLDKKSDNHFPLAKYAARSWKAHAQFEDVSLHVKDGMRSLFNPNKPHLARWLRWLSLMHASDEPNPLYYASFWGFDDLVEHLAINHPELVNTIDGQFDTPLLAALSGKHFRVAESLLRHDAKVDLPGLKGRTALHTAIIYYDDMGHSLPDVMLFLLKHGAHVDSRDGDFRTPLHWAALFDNLEAAQWLLDHGADIDARDGKGTTPLHQVFKDQYDGDSRPRYGDLDPCFARLFSKHGTNVNAQDQDGNTPLYLAMEQESWEAVRILLENGTNLLRETEDGSTAYLYRVLESDLSSHERLDLVRLLLKRGAKVNAQSWPPVGETPLHLAVLWEYEIAEVLLEHSADPNMKDDDGCTPLHQLLIYHKDTVQVLGLMQSLLERGADVNSLGRDNDTPLHLAMKAGHQVAHVLLKCGAEPNMKNNKGKTPLHLLLEREYPDDDEVKDLLVVGRLLLESGADVNAQDEDNTTPLYLASNLRIPAMFQLILNHANAEKGRRRALLHITLEGEYNF
jgi:ankyrin repeat protein